MFSERNNHSQSLFLFSSHERRMTFMQFFIAGQFLFCYSLPSVLDVMDTIHIINGTDDRSWYLIYLIDLSNILVIANSALRIFVYYVFGGVFRQQLFSLIRRSFLSGDDEKMDARLYSYPLRRSWESRSTNNRLVVISKFTNQSDYWTEYTVCILYAYLFVFLFSSTVSLIVWFGWNSWNILCYYYCKLSVKNFLSLMLLFLSVRKSIVDVLF